MWRIVIFLLVSFYILAGLPLAPFHGDEGQHLWLSQDYVAYFVLHQPPKVSQPIQIDSESYLRLLNGTVSAYGTGFILWQSHTLSLDNWQPAWYFGEDVAMNRAAGRYPKSGVLFWGRLASALFLISTVALLLTPIWKTEGIIIALLLAFHPVILLNSRRVMQEGALIFFTLALATQVLRIRQNPSPFNYVLYGILAGLALATKPTALIPLIGLTLVLLKPHLKIIVMGIIALAVYLLLTPVLWSNPVQLTLQAAHLRAAALDGQMEASGVGYANWGERFWAMLENPFPNSIQYFESPAFADDTDLKNQIRYYDSSGLPGWNPPGLIAWSLAPLGLWRLWREKRSLLPWVGLTGLMILLAVPMAWQRYYLPWTVTSLLVLGFGILEICEISAQIRHRALN